jgi:hypothetical protein
MSQFKTRSQEVKALKNGNSVYITNYSVPRKQNDPNAILEDIQTFASNKSHKMSENNNLQDKNVNVAVQFQDNTWISSAFAGAGSDIEIDMYEYTEDSLAQKGNIKSFKITFY